MAITSATHMPRYPTLSAPEPSWPALRRGAAAAQQQMADTFEPHRVRHMAIKSAQRLALLGAGAGIAAAAATLSYGGLIPGLLALTQQADEVGSILGTFPLVGRILELTVGRGGVIGAALTSASLLGVTSTLLLSDGPIDTTVRWVLAHIGMGMALAPLMMPGAAASGGVIALALGAALVASYCASTRLIHGRTALWEVAIGLGATLVMGPVGAQVALSATQGSIMGAAVLTASLSVVAFCVYVWIDAWSLLTDAKAPLVRQFEVPAPQGQRLRFVGSDEGNIYGMSDALDLELRAAARNRSQGVRLGVRKYCFVGAPGTGKALFARGIAQHLKASLVAPPSGVIASDPQGPATLIKKLFDQARAHTLLARTPLVLFFEDFDQLTGRHDDNFAASIDYRSQAVALTFRNELGQDNNTDKQNLVIIIACKTEVGIPEDFLVEHFGALSADEQSLLFVEQINQALTSSVLRRATPYKPEPDRLERWARQAQGQEMTGQQVRTVARRAINRVVAQWPEGEPYEAELVHARVHQALENNFPANPHEGADT